MEKSKKNKATTRRKASNPVGRPSGYEKKYCGKLIEHMEKGYSLESFGGVVNHGKQTLYNWMRDHQEFLDAYEIGRVKSQFFWEKLGVAGTAGRINGFKERTWNFNMKNRFDWRERMEHSGEISQKSNLTEYRKIMSNPEMAQKALELAEFMAEEGIDESDS